MFENSSAILPHLEQPRTGATSLFCAELAKNLGCYVIAGYPERLNSQELHEISKSEAGSRPQVTENGTEIHQVGANSAAFYDPDGVWVGGYRKSHLFKIDLSWAKAGKWTSLAAFDEAELMALLEATDSRLSLFLHLFAL